MVTVNHYPSKLHYKETKSLTPFERLQFSRPVHQCQFVSQGDQLHLLIYLDGNSQVPFLRISSDRIYHAAKAYMRNI